MKAVLICMGLVMTVVCQAKDLGFRFKENKCIDEMGKIGLNPGFVGQCGNLSNVTVSRFNFEDADLSGSKFEGSDLQGSLFRQANLTATSFAGANLSGVDMENAIIHQSNMSQATLVNIHLAGADLIDVDFTAADLSGALLSFMKFTGAKFKGAKMNGATMDHVDLSGIDLTGINLTGVNLAASNLSKTVLDKAIFQGADLTGDDLSQASGSNVNFNGAILRKIRFTNSTLKMASLKGAQMDGADLTGSNFSGSNLRSAVLKGAVVKDAVFTDVQFNRKTVLPFSVEDAKTFGMVLIRTPAIAVWMMHADVAEEGKHTLEALRKAVPDLEDSDISILMTDDVTILRTKLVESTVFLVPEQEKSVNRMVQKQLGPDLDKFVKAGGIVVTCADYQGFLNDTGLLPSTNASNVNNGKLPVVNSKSPIADGLGATIEAKDATFGLNVAADAGFDIVVGTANQNFVIARNLGKGTIVNLGYDFFQYNDDAQKILGNAIMLAY